MGNTFQKMAYPGPYPETFGTPTFDSHYGFSGERKKRVMPVSNDVLMDAHVPLDRRDYCSDFYLDFLKCHRRQFPFPQMCRTEIHKYHKCEYEDDKLRMMEYERERRLLIREKRKQKKAQAAAA